MKKKKLIKTIQIAFNLNDPQQKKMYDHVKQFTNESFYGKSLILRDMNNTWGNSNLELNNSQVDMLDLDIIKSFI